MKKILIIGKRGFIGKSLYQYLKRYFYIEIISFKDLTKFKKKINSFNFIINTSINKKYIYSKYNSNFDNDLQISRNIRNKETIYCFISTRKVYPNKPNLKENTKPYPSDNYGKNKLITEQRLKKKIKDNLLILRVSNIIGDIKSTKRVHKTFVDIFLENAKNGIIFNNGVIYKDFLSIDKFCEIVKCMIRKKILGTYNVSIGQKIYVNDLISWLNKYNGLAIINNGIKLNKSDSFYLNNKKLMSKIKIKNTISELQKYCYNFSKKQFS